MSEHSFEDFSNYSDMKEMINEVQIQFNRNRDNKFGNVIILAGGAGSGKGFVLDNLIGMEGKVFDVDKLKELAIKSAKINDLVQKEFKVSLADMDLRNSDDVGKLHDIIGDQLRLPKKKEQAFFASVLAGDPSRKPNVIFDVTLKDAQKLSNITRHLADVGYDKKKIHIVWVVNDVNVAISQNANRDRVVPEFILMNTHRGVSSTMYDLINMGSKMRQVVDGDIFFAMNKFKVDTETVDNKKAGGTGFYIKKALYVQIKKSGEAPMKIEDISKDVLAKIDAYTPNVVKWGKD